MNHPTYKDQFDKLTRAYIHNEIDTWNCMKCFCGNLLNNKCEWAEGRDVINGMARGAGSLLDSSYHFFIRSEACVTNESNGFYTLQDIADLEVVFLNTFKDVGGNEMAWRDMQVTQKDEDALFIAFEVALEHLKRLHISKGENVDETFEFKKRELKIAL